MLLSLKKFLDKEAALNLFKHSQNKEMKVNNNETIDQRSLSPNNNVRNRKISLICL